MDTCQWPKVYSTCTGSGLGSKGLIMKQRKGKCRVDYSSQSYTLQCHHKVINVLIAMLSLLMFNFIWISLMAEMCILNASTVKLNAKGCAVFHHSFSNNSILHQQWQFHRWMTIYMTIPQINDNSIGKKTRNKQ